MSDLLSPILYVIEDESEAFWCFAALMERMAPNFHRDQNGMHSQLMALSKVNETSLLAVGLKLFLRMLYHFMVACFYVVIFSISSCFFSFFFPLLVPVSTCANPLCRAMFACKEAATSDTPGLLVLGAARAVAGQSIAWLLQAEWMFELLFLFPLDSYSI